MIRPFTLVTALLAATSGLYLFAVKHQAQVLDDQLAGIAQQAQLDGQRIRVLQAQWALETDPSQLAALAGQFTGLKPMQPAQMVTLAGLGAALPAPGSAAPGQNPEAVGTATAAVQLAQTSVAPNGLPLPPPLPQGLPQTQPQSAPVVLAAARPVVLAAARPVVPAAERPIVLTAARPMVLAAARAHPHGVREAEHEIMREARVTHGYESPALVMGAEAAPARTVPYVQPVMQQVSAVQAPPEAASSVLPAAAGSVLGMAAELAPPQPLGSGN